MVPESAAVQIEKQRFKRKDLKAVEVIEIKTVEVGSHGDSRIPKPFASGVRPGLGLR
jgi:hypothetical protein